MNNVLTASRMVAMLQCPRKHYWQYEVGLLRELIGLALKIGAAWARGQEARWHGMKYEDALAAAIPEGIELDEYSCATIAALLAGYYARYSKQREPIKKIHPEEEFHFELGFADFIVAGKLDGLGTKWDNASCIAEGKTTGDSIAPDAQYWQRLKFNMQVFQYVDAAMHNGWEIAEFIYDVTRKPQIHPKQVQEMDGNSLIVRGADGKRVKNSRNGEWKKTADKSKGEYINSAIETPSQFSDRLFQDTLDRPDFYFARREVPIIDHELEQFRAQRLAIAYTIISLRALQADIEQQGGRPENAWPRNVLESTCTYCPYKSFCLQNQEIDINQPPEGFSVQPFNPELNYERNTTAQDDSTAD